MPLFIDPLRDLGTELLAVEKPARYTGGEFGCLAKRETGKPEREVLRAVIAFPDLYEIGMSNHAVKIIYNRLNALDGIECDRAFAPAADFETLLANKNIPLYGLDTGIPLCDIDMLLFTLGYELGITALLAMLKSAQIPLYAEERSASKNNVSENDTYPEFPVVITGGVCVSNPLPYAKFIDAFWIGEAEAGFFDLMVKVRKAKKAGAGRAERLQIVRAHPSVWYAGKPVNKRGFAAVRAVYAGFSAEQSAAVYPVPSMRVVQQHGYVEIMRGCPNGCRFCHAGMWYRPMRQKDAALIISDVEAYIRKGGFREISLSSLSSADYNGIDSLIYQLNNIYENQYISFQLPSLHVSTFSLPLLEAIAKIRKSGLTFAVETPQERRQFSLNKTVSLESAAEILIESKKRGWKGAKLYFMTGLPEPAGETANPAAGGAPAGTLPGEETEEAAIINFVKELARRVHLSFTVNAGIFVPKPHTPFERAAQPEKSGEKTQRIIAALRPLGHKVNASNNRVARVEGLIARGDERVSAVIEAAFNAGSRLDAWSDQFRFDIWALLEKEYAALFAETLAEKAPDAPLPWDCIDSGVRPAYLAAEQKKSRNSELTPPCAPKCRSSCGACSRTCRLRPAAPGRPAAAGRLPAAGRHTAADSPPPPKPVLRRLLDAVFAGRPAGPGRPGRLPPPPEQAAGRRLLDTAIRRPLEQAAGRRPLEAAGPAAAGLLPQLPSCRMIFSYAKTGAAVFLAHLSVIEVFQAALQRAGVPAAFTLGFNPMPALSFASPLSVGIHGENEIASIDLARPCAEQTFITSMNAALPAGLRVRRALCVSIPYGDKKIAVPSILWGCAYLNDDGGFDEVPAAAEKNWRAARYAQGKTPLGLVRHAVFAASAAADAAGSAADAAADTAGTAGHESYFDFYARRYGH